MSPASQFPSSSACPTLAPAASVLNGPATPFALASVEDALADFAKGDFLVVVDDEDRENEGDLIIAAEKITVSRSRLPLLPRSGAAHVDSCCPLALFTSPRRWHGSYGIHRTSTVSGWSIGLIPVHGERSIADPELGLQRLHLHLPARRTAESAGYQNDVRGQPGSQQDGLHRHL